ncbi:MAG TPA: S-layer homology domain-containing protein [Bacillus sp. (in: firmicutes)]|nr:S-layer homology domain-containing protein [Bacillus sp. (in: firmicutes)]
MKRIILTLLFSLVVGSFLLPYSANQAQAAGVNKLIMGESSLSARQMAAFVKEKNPSNIRLHGISVDRLAELYLKIGAEEGVRGDVAFAQAIKETGYFKFGGDVRPEQHNYAGIGATGGGSRGNSFSTAEKGVYAQIQHLKAYASTKPLNTALVDPRFKYVTRGIAPTWPDLHKRWAMQANGNYGEDILSIYEEMSRMPVSIVAPLEQVSAFPDSYPIDVNKGYWAEKEIAEFLDLQIISGFKNELGQTFLKPNDSITRAQFVKILVNALGLKNSGQALSFGDVHESDWFYPYVQTAASLGITTGSHGLFKPNEQIKRDQMAAMIYRASHLQLNDNEWIGSTNSFKDVSSDYWAYPFISKAALAGIISGYEDGTFKPLAYATRAQGIVMIHRMMQKLNK